MNKFRRRRGKLLGAWAELRTRKKKAIVIGFLCALLAILSVWISLHQEISFFRLQVEYSYGLVVESIKEGDAAFKDYRYAEATRSYRRAERTLERLIEFENRSPSKDLRVLQRYYNSETFIKARLQLAAVADDISRLQYSSSPDGQEVPMRQDR